MELYTVRQNFPRPQCENAAGLAADQAARLPLKFLPGAKIAVAVGSRGISNLAQIVRGVVSKIKGLGGKPIIVPAMGSHGGATPEGQSAVLAGYGITPETMGAPVVSSLEVVELPASKAGTRVFMDRAAFESDGIILINRIKPHTDFHGRFESGLVKMGVVGLGKHAAASEIHSFGIAGFLDQIPSAFETVLASGKIVGGIAIVENAYDEIAHIEGIPGPRIMEREPELLDMARQNMPRLPVDDIDVLIIDRMGKDISGVGIDPNIIGRMRIRGQEEPTSPRIAGIMVSRLSDHTYGNAIGIGLADVITRDLFNAIDFQAMYINVRTSLFLERVKVPYIAETDREGIALSLATCGKRAGASPRIVRILDTLHLGEVQVSEAVLKEIGGRAAIVHGPRNIFCQNGDLCGWNG